MKSLPSLQRRSRGAALIEYGLLVGLVSVVVIGSVLSWGRQADTLFTVVPETHAKAPSQVGY